MRQTPGAATPLVETVSFRLGVLGSIVTDQLAERIKDRELKPKHLGLMALLDARPPASQLELARTMGVAPSLMVTLADHLSALGAIRRDRDPADRRRQVLTLTDHGRTLLAECAEVASALDTEFTAALTDQVMTGLRDALRTLAAGLGLPTAER